MGPSLVTGPSSWAEPRSLSHCPSRSVQALFTKAEVEIVSGDGAAVTSLQPLSSCQQLLRRAGPTQAIVPSSRA